MEAFPGKGVTVFWAQILQMTSFCILYLHSEFVAGLKLTCFRHLSPEDTSNGLLTMLFALLLLGQNFHLLFLPVSYMIIGLTSLCLYNITTFLLLQDGILYKLYSLYLCKIQKSTSYAQKLLTVNPLPCYDIHVRGLWVSYFYWQKCADSSCNGGKTVVN